MPITGASKSRASLGRGQHVSGRLTDGAPLNRRRPVNRLRRTRAGRRSSDEAPAHDAAAPSREVLVVEDEPQMRALLTDNLEFEGYHVTAVESAEQALAELAHRAVSLLIVDVMLPGMSGFALCEQLRNQGTRVPIIILTARTHEQDRVRGLDIGADDYVSKPFSVQELLARVRAQVRRDDWHSETGPEFTFGDVKVNVRQRLVVRKGRRLPLSAREFELLRYLLAHRNEIVSREQLLRDVWGYHQLSVTRTVDNYIAKLRTQLEPRPHEPRYIVTVHGSGYQLIG